MVPDESIGFVHPTIHSRVVQVDTAFFHHLFQLAIANAVFAIPPHSPENDLSYKVPTFEIMCHSSTLAGSTSLQNYDPISAIQFLQQRHLPNLVALDVTKG